MTDEKYGALLGAFARHYWSLPLAFAIDHITQWLPEIAPEQTQRVVQRCIDSFYWHNCTIEENGLAEPELVTEHLLAVDADSFDRFLAARLNVPIRECEESVLFRSDRYYLAIPEAKAVYDFGQQELGLDDEWADQLVNDCFLCQPSALCEGESWVMGVLAMESFGKIRFGTIAQVECFRDLGNKLYQVTPNPVFRGWKPSELENSPTLRDNIPERAEDIPNHRGEMDTFFAQFGGRGKFLQQRMECPSDPVPKRRKVGRNEPCPCGSGKKYKKCCGRNAFVAGAETTNKT